MDLRVHDSFSSFWADAGPLYESDPGRHSVPLTMMAARASYEGGPAPVLLTMHDSEVVVAAYLRTPPLQAHVSAVPADLAPAVVDLVRRVDSDVATVFGPQHEAHAFAFAWCGGDPGTVVSRQRRYELGELERPRDVSGQVRAFDSNDVTWLAQWRTAYARETGDSGVGRDPSEGSMRRFIDGGRVPVLWAVDGEPVAMAFVSVPLCGMARIGYVYTPTEHRGNGFGAAVTAAASEVAREMGASLVMLYADLANPVSNAIYQKIGFQPVDDLVELALRRSRTAESTVSWG